jgi:hypothetical protein
VSRIERGELEPSPSVKIIFNAIVAPTSPDQSKERVA